MAASIISSAVVAPAQASMVAPFTGLKSTSAFPVTRKLDTDITSLASNGGRVQCMKVWPPLGLKKFETLSYLPPLTQVQLGKEGIPTIIHPYHWIRQQAPSAVHQFHLLQASWLLNLHNHLLSLLFSR
ncbi:hypothetical protein CsSME_00022380 [Camellia sinensis var. sinensis]